MCICIFKRLILKALSYITLYFKGNVLCENKLNNAENKISFCLKYVERYAVFFLLLLFLFQTRYHKFLIPKGKITLFEIDYCWKFSVTLRIF